MSIQHLFSARDPKAALSCKSIQEIKDGCQKAMERKGKPNKRKAHHEEEARPAKKSFFCVREDIFKDDKEYGDDLDRLEEKVSRMFLEPPLK